MAHTAVCVLICELRADRNVQYVAFATRIRLLLVFPGLVVYLGARCYSCLVLMVFWLSHNRQSWGELNVSFIRGRKLLRLKLIRVYCAASYIAVGQVCDLTVCPDHRCSVSADGTVQVGGRGNTKALRCCFFRCPFVASTFGRRATACSTAPCRPRARARRKS